MKRSSKTGFVKSIRMICIIMLLSLLSASLCGCWNYREIENLSAVYSFGIDKAPKGEGYLLTVEVNALESSGKDSSLKPKLLTSQGSTIMEAVANLGKTSDKEIYWSQAKVGIIGRQVAEEGVRQLVDTMLRDEETRIDMYLVVSKEKTAKQIMMLSEENPSEMLGVRLSRLIESQKNLSKAPSIHVYEMADMMANPYQSGVLGAVDIASEGEEKTAQLSGAALFHNGRLQGFLSSDESQYLLFAMNRYDKGHIAVEGVEGDPDIKASVQIDKSKTSIKPVYENGTISMDMYIKTSCGIEELYNPNNMSDEKVEAEVKKRCKDIISEKTLSVVQKVQEEYGVDTFGFSNTFIKKNPSLWKKIDDRWYEVFSKLPVRVHTHIRFTNTGEVEILSEEEV